MFSVVVALECFIHTSMSKPILVYVGSAVVDLHALCDMLCLSVVAVLFDFRYHNV